MPATSDGQTCCGTSAVQDRQGQDAGKGNRAATNYFVELPCGVASAGRGIVRLSPFLGFDRSVPSLWRGRRLSQPQLSQRCLQMPTDAIHLSLSQAIVQLLCYLPI